MKTSDFYFDLPNHFIAQEPAHKRDASRLLVLNKKTGAVIHANIRDLSGFIPEGTVVVINNSRVRKARIFGLSKETGGKVEFLLLDEISPGKWNVLTSKAKKQKPGKSFIFPGRVKARIIGCAGCMEDSGGIRQIEFLPHIDENYLEKHGHVPLPPYIKREDTHLDSTRYQTIYARHTGSAAAPTAGLHLTEEIMCELIKRDIVITSITLHVGLGTFLPIRTQNIEEHKMHTESYSIPVETARLVNEAQNKGRPVLAVGTTSVRTLEAAWKDNKLASGQGNTDIFICPGYDFKVVSRMLTNFHTPESTLLVLVSAFAGRERILSAYTQAVSGGYRFFSYGDAMLIQ